VNQKLHNSLPYNSNSVVSLEKWIGKKGFDHVKRNSGTLINATFFKLFDENMFTKKNIYIFV